VLNAAQTVTILQLHRSPILQRRIERVNGNPFGRRALTGFKEWDLIYKQEMRVFDLNTGIRESDFSTCGPVKSMGRGAALALPK
jgi:hypothetical protein